MGFLTQLKLKMVGIDREMMSGVSVGAKLSRRAVMKEHGLRQVCLQQRSVRQHCNEATLD